MNYALALALSLLVQYSPLPLPTPEEGQWKAHSSPYDKFLPSRRDEALPFWPWTAYHAS